jgi:D-alanyl-D-alanine carboxypeptidase
MKKLCCVVLLVVYCLTGFTQAFGLMADSVRKYRGVPGLVYAVFNTDGIVDIGASGVREFRKKDSVRITDHFYIGTNTTAFTTYLAARLAETGKISLSTPLIKVMPELNGKTMKLYHKVTLSQFLTQRAGIKPYAEERDWREFASLTGGKTEQRKVFTTLVLKQTPLLVVDSTQAIYSMAGTVIASTMLEKATNKSWEDLVGQYISKPLNISIRFGLPRLTDSLQPSGHSDAHGGLVANAGNYTLPAMMPATDINISLKDYIVFLQDILKALAHKKAVLGASAAELLLYGQPGYAMGWENEVWKNLHVAQYLGKSPLFSSYTMIVKEKNLGIIVMCNSGTVSGKSAVLNFARMLREYYCE